MYNDDEMQEEEEEEYSSGNKWKDFYDNNKKLIWIAGIVLVALLVLTLLSKIGGSKSSSGYVLMANNEVVKEQTIVRNNTLLLSAKDGGKSVNVTWRSDNEAVATVSSDGLVRGISAGKATISATSTGGKTISCVVTVTEGDKSIVLTNVSFRDGDLLMSVGSSYIVDLLTTPSNGYIETKSFRSDNISVATVSDDGTIKGIKSGSANITVTVNGKYSDTLSVRVVDKKIASRIVTSVESLTFANAKDKVGVGQTKKLDFTINPANADPATIIWKSGNEKVVTVDEDGNATGVTVGTALVEASTLGGKRIGSVTVEVEDGVISVPTSLSLKVGTSQNITLTGNLTDDTRKNLTFKSSDPSIAGIASKDGGKTVDITAYAKTGTAILTIMSGNVEKARITVTVTGNDPTPIGGGGGGGSTSTESNCAPSRGSRGYGVSSVDKNNGQFLNNCYSKVGSSNAATGYINITFTLDSGIDSLKVCKYKYGSTACNPDTSGTTIKNNQTYKISETGTWVIRVSEYSGTSKKRGPDYWYVTINDGTGESTPTTTGKACYCNSSSCIYTNSPSAGYTKQVSVKSYSGCVTYSSNKKKGCFKKTSDDTYAWGSYGLSSLYEIDDSIKNENDCKKRIEKNDYCKSYCQRNSNEELNKCMKSCME